MSDRHPARTFENYPIDSAAAERDPEPPGPLTGWRATPPPSPAPPKGPSRRRMIGAIGAGVVALGAAAWVVRDGSIEAVVDPEGEVSMTADSEEPVQVGDYDVERKQGWELSDHDGDSSATLTRGGNTVVFRYFDASSDATAAEEAERLLKRHAAEVSKRGEIRTSSSGYGDLEMGTARTSGRVAGKPVDVEARVSIEREHDEVLAVIAIVLEKASDIVRRDIARMRDTFLDQLG